VSKFSKSSNERLGRHPGQGRVAAYISDFFSAITQHLH
jgi:hypothetical protein